MKLVDIVKRNIYIMPHISHYINNIKKKGLGGNNKKNWNDSKDNVVYLADDPDIAESFAEANEEINEQWLDEIIIFKIKTKDLDQNKLFIDENVILDDDEFPHTFEYHGIITWNLLKKYK